MNIDTATIIVPSSSANLGIFFDIGSIGLVKPNLKVTFTKSVKKKGLELKILSTVKSVKERILGYAGKKALENLLSAYKIKEGGVLTISDADYPIAGLGRSGAEAVGAVLAAAVVHSIKLSRNEVIQLSSLVEPNQHLDNVAASTNGLFNLIARSPFSQKIEITTIAPPEKLGIAIGITSHLKHKGTSTTRKVLARAVKSNIFVPQWGRIAVATTALIKSDLNLFLELICGDNFHESRRVNAGMLGNFKWSEFFSLKKELFVKYKVALNISGAGPAFSFLHNKKYHKYGLSKEVVIKIKRWFANRKLRIELKDLKIANEGAYDYARKKYNYHY